MLRESKWNVRRITDWDVPEAKYVACNNLVMNLQVPLTDLLPRVNYICV
jgi:hypothetical protein